MRVYFFASTSSVACIDQVVRVFRRVVLAVLWTLYAPSQTRRVREKNGNSAHTEQRAKQGAIAPDATTEKATKTTDKQTEDSFTHTYTK